MKVLYIFEPYSFRNTSLSVGNTKATGTIAMNKIPTETLKVKPTTVIQLDLLV